MSRAVERVRHVARACEHVCPLHSTPAEQFALVEAHLREGLTHNERCLLLVPERALGEITTSLHSANMSVETDLARGSLELFTEADVFERGRRFDPQGMIEWLESAASEARERGFAGMRLIADMRWALDAGLPVDRLIEYEALLNDYVALHQVDVLCLYDRRRWDSAVIHDVLRTHPVAIVGGLVCPNPYYDPELLLGRSAAEGEAKRARAEWWIRKLEEGRAAELARERTAEELRHERDHIQLLLNSTAEGIYGVDLEGRCTFANPACERLLGVESPRGLIGENMHELTHHTRPDGSPFPLAECEIHGTWSQEGRYHMDEYFWRGNGTALNAECFSHPMRQDGRTVGAVVTFFDTSERKRLEEQLRQSQKLDAIGRLAGGIAHDFNNLLTVIIAYSEMLLAPNALSYDTRSMLGEILKAGNRGASLTHQLLAFSRSQVLTLKLVDLNRIVSEFETMLRRVVVEDVQLVLRLDSSLPVIKADPAQIEQVLLNLAINSRDAMPRGGSLTIETARCSRKPAGHSSGEANTWVRLSVHDTGCGMSEAVKRRVFEPFFTTKECGKGTGLGLAVVHGIVEQSGGTIEVESQLAQGCSFHVYLPSHEHAHAEAEPESEPSPSVAPGNETVLIVEDEESVRSMLAQVLTQRGYQVLTAPRGEEALDAFGGTKGRRLDLLVTDVVMPGMSGVTLAQTMMAAHPHLRVLYLSGHTDDAVLRHGLKQNGLGLLNKPFSPDALVARVQEILK